jgi:hypothetical protein
MRVLILCAFLLTSIAQAQVIERSTPAFSYCGLTGTTKFDLVGTLNLASGHGKVEVERERGGLEIKTKAEHLVPAGVFGAEYLTYVLWAISPDGSPLNLGEMALDSNNHARLEVMTNLQTFGLIVTAEPYFAVTQPSDVVVLVNSVSPRAGGPVRSTRVKYDALPAGYYIANVRPVDVMGTALINFNPPEVNQAENAIRIARWRNAGEYAPDALARAESGLPPQEAVFAAEDARLLAVMRQGNETETCRSGSGRKP